MEIFQNISELRREISGGKFTLGLVPTMGYLHDGHISLIRRSKGQNIKTAVSIFVNPTQFNRAEDLDNYPNICERVTKTRRLDQDIVQIILDMPFPFDGRDYIVKYKIENSDNSSSNLSDCSSSVKEVICNTKRILSSTDNFVNTEASCVK